MPKLTPQLKYERQALRSQKCIMFSFSGSLSATEDNDSKSVELDLSREDGGYLLEHLEIKRGLSRYVYRRSQQLVGSQSKFLSPVLKSKTFHATRTSRVRWFLPTTIKIPRTQAQGRDADPNSYYDNAHTLLLNFPFYDPFYCTSV
jgi:hypothetical protein